MERIFNSPSALKYAVWLAQTAPGRLGYAIAGMAAAWISSRRDSGPVRAVRSNQWIVAGKNSSAETLDQVVHDVFLNSARSIYELYHTLHRPGELERMYRLAPSFEKIMDHSESGGNGLVVAGLHMAGFDLGLQWLGMHQFRPLLLTIPDPEGSRQFEFETRQKTGMHVVPGSVTGLRQAIRQIQKGGTVLTGIDHPIPDADPRTKFFGQPANLPVHHIYLALKTHVPVVVVASRQEEDGRYLLLASAPIDMEANPNRGEELRINAEKVLAVAEGFIRPFPQQWLISLPVWPAQTSQILG